jgi:hypothetical protein
VQVRLLCAEFADAAAESPPQECLDFVLQLAPRYWQLHGSNNGLKLQPEGSTLLIGTINDY